MIGRVLRTGLLGKARTLFHGSGPKGEYPSRWQNQPIRCEACKFWAADRYLGMPEECRRSAPGFGRDRGGFKQADWPRTEPHQRCGEFARR